MKTHWSYLGHTIYLASSRGAKSGTYKVYDIPGKSFGSVDAAKKAIKSKFKKRATK